MSLKRSKYLFDEALKIFSGGVNSPVRAAVKPYPFFVKSAKGSHLYTVDGEVLIDYVLGYGPLILGHRPPAVVEAVQKQLERGCLFGTPTELEVELAKRILNHVMHKGKIRFVNSGTEATMTAIRLARGFTGRSLIIKFDGCYHGSHDSLLVSTGSAASEYGIPNSLGVPNELAKLTLVARYNDINSVKRIMKKHGNNIAAIIVEPVVANMGVIPSRRDFLRALRELSDDHGILLIFDEVVTGFRLALGGAQEYYGVKADIVTLGKIIGGGFPIGAIVAKEEVLDFLTPKGKVFNAGTFNAHPISMAAGLATLSTIENDDTIKRASRISEQLSKIFEDHVSELKIPHWINRVESMFQIFFTEGPVKDADDARKSKRDVYSRLHEGLLKRGVFIPPSQFETVFLSNSHTKEDLERTGEALAEAIREAVRRPELKWS